MAYRIAWCTVFLAIMVLPRPWAPTRTRFSARLRKSRPRTRSDEAAIDLFRPVPLEVGHGLEAPEAREDVRRHVEHVRHVGRDLRVSVRRRQRQVRQLRRVVGVDQVVRDARVLRVRGRDRVEQPRCLLLPRVRAIRRRGGRAPQQASA